MYSSLKIVRKLSYAWMYYPNGLDTGFSISKGYITGDEVTSLLQIIEQGKTKRPEVYLEDVTVIDEFTGGSEITFATFYELEQYLVLLNNPLTVDIIGGDFAGSPDSNKFLIRPAFMVDGNLITVQPNGVWKINSVTYSNPTQVVKEVPLCSAGKSRLDYIVPNNSNGFDIVSGIEVDSSPIAPQIPYDNLFVTFYIVTDESIQNPQEPVNNQDFVQKLEAQDFMVGYNSEVVVDKVILIDNRSSIVAINQVNEILSLEVLPQNIRPGKPVFVRNNTVGNLLLRGNSGSGNVKFSKDITIKPGDTLQFKLNSQNSTLELVGTNPFDKLDTSVAYDINTRIDNILFPDAILSRGDIDLSGNTMTILTGEFTVRINQIEVTNVDDFVEVINEASPGYNRTDIIVLDENGNFIRIEGEESLDIAVKPNPLPNTIEITSIDVSEVGPQPIQPLPDYNALYFKRFKQTYKTSQPVFDINPDEDDYNIIFTNTATTVVKIYPNGSYGKFIKNNSTHPLKSRGTGNVVVEAQPGVTLNAPNGLILNKGQQCYLIKDEYDTWTLINPCEAPNLSSKQDTLVSGENIKTVNNQSLLGTGNIEILADGTVPLSAFLDTVNGNDATALIENPRKTFKTINALLNALPATTGETYDIYIVAGNVSFTRKITRRNLRFIAYNTSALIFDGVKENDGTTNAAFLFSGLSGGINYTWTFENSNIGFSCSRAFQFGHQFNTGVIFKGNIDAMVWAAGAIYVQPNSNLKINNVSNFGGTLMASGNSASVVASYIEIDFFNITSNANIINQYKGVLRINNLVKTNIGVVNNIQFSVPNSSTNEITLEFKNITHNGLIETFVKNINFIDANINSLANFNFGKINGAPQTVVSGTLNSTLFLDSGYFANGAYFKNFTGRVGGATLANGIYTFENCNITCNTTLTNRWSAATLKEAVFFKGYNTITQLVASDLIGAEAETTVEVAGVVKTNAKSFGTRVKSVYPNATYKEKLFEVVVRSKSDIVNRVLDSSTTYIIDGKLVLTTNEYIEVPATGLTLVGYGFNVSGISKNVANQSIFKSPASGGSGDFITRDIVYNSGAGSVFNLTNVAGNNAIEMNDVNFENCTSLGKLTSYRQFTGTTNGFYGCLDGIQLSGNWTGFKLTNSNVLAFGGSGTFIKKDTDTLFSNRMYLDLNLSFNAGGKLCDFDQSNFASDELFQINNTLLRIGGVTNESNTTSAIPNIAANNPKCRWTNSLGITLTAQKFQDLKSATKNWRISVDDAGVISATEI